MFVDFNVKLNLKRIEKSQVSISLSDDGGKTIEKFVVSFREMPLPQLKGF